MLRFFIVVVALRCFASGTVYDEQLLSSSGKIYHIKYSNIVNARGVTNWERFEICIMAPPTKITFEPRKPFLGSDFNVTVLSTTKYGFGYRLETTPTSSNRSKWVEIRYTFYFARKDIQHPCANNGWCMNRGTKHECGCRGGFTGENCTEELKVCSSNPCVEGYCVPTDDGHKCHCKTGYVGKTCSEGLETGLEKMNLQNSSEIFLKIPFKRCRSESPLRVKLELTGNPKSMKIRLMDTTKFGFKVRIRRKRRKLAKLKWEAYFRAEVFEVSPCVYSVACTNSYDGHKCDCPDEYSGTYCESERQTCYTRSCNNGGTCFNTEDDLFCYCTYGFTGKYCSERINCTSNPCRNGGTCNDTGTSYSCSCPEGFTSHNCGRRKENCTKSTCKHGGRCRNTPKGFKCDCPPGRAGFDCTKRKVLPFDFSYDGCVGNGGKYRKNLVGPGYDCACKPSYAPNRCWDRYINGTIAMALNNTVMNNRTIEVIYEDCHKEKAFWVEASFDKTFSDLFEINVTNNQVWGFTISVTQLAMIDVNWSAVDTSLKWKANIRHHNFRQNPCKNGGICVNSKQGQHCSCPSRFKGPLCETEIQDCSVPCENGGTCVETQNSFECQCPEIYGGKYCHLRAYSGTYKVRMPKYEKDWSYTYKMKPCVGGYPLSAAARITNLGQHKKSIAITSVYDTPQGFQYTVRRKKGSRNSGQEVLDVEWKLLYELKGYKREYCENGGRCQYVTEYKKKCRCRPQYHGDRCQHHIVDCDSNPCQNGGTCHGTVGYSCTCLPRFSGRDCSYEIRLEGSVPTTITYLEVASWGRWRKSISVTYSECIKSPAGVIDAVLMYNGTQLPGVAINVKENLIGGFRLKTKLKNEYIISNFGVDWSINATVKWKAYVKPTNQSVCENGGVCTNHKRAHHCACPPGFLGDHCQQVDYCKSTPCANGATCSVKTNGYTCTCAYGYFGHRCNYEIPQHLRMYRELYPEDEPDNVYFTNSWES